MAEWLRRWTRNPMGSSRAGSNPARSEKILFLIILNINFFRSMFFPPRSAQFRILLAMSNVLLL